MRLIDADDLTKYIEEIHCENCDNWNEVKCKACEIGGGLDYIYGAPTVEERKHGHWDYSNIAKQGYKCSVCNRSSKNGSPFCQWCGARMDESEVTDEERDN